MTDDDLRALYRRGLIPGPHEGDAAFIERVDRSPPLPPDPAWAEAHQITQAVFGFAIDWIPIDYSARGLFPWEGAAVWDGPPVRMQLHPRLQKGTLWGYHRSEILAHETVHLARIAFQQPQFEELFAYRTSRSLFRRRVGPLFRRSWESLGMMTPLMPLFLLYFGGRLVRAHTFLRQALRKASLSSLLCLTDLEIRAFAAGQSIDLQGIRGRMWRISQYGGLNGFNAF